MNKLTVLSFAALLTTFNFSCVEGTVSDSASIHEQVVFPGAKQLGLEDAALPPSGLIQIPPQTFTFDISQVIAQLSKVGTLSLTVQKNTLSDTNMAFVNEVIVFAQPSDHSSPMVVISDYMVGSNPGPSIDMPVSDIPTFIQYASDGSVDLNIQLIVDVANIPVNQEVFDYDLDLGLAIAIKK
jgi:hypothetical protein